MINVELRLAVLQPALSSGRRSSRPATATSRRRIRWSASRGRSTPCAQLKAACPNSIFVGTGYTYLQEYLPHVAQAVVREGWADFVGVGRLVLSYWDMPADTLAGRADAGEDASAARSATARPPRATASSAAASRSTRTTRTRPSTCELKTTKAELRKRLTVLKQ